MASELTDRTALARNRRRAAADPVTFLHELAADIIQDRLMMVNKPLPQRTVVSGFGNLWSQYFPDANHIPDDDVLNLEPKSYDLVIHAMGLHWSNDPVGQLIQVRNALRPDGLFLGVCFGGQTLHELRSALGQAEVQVAGGLSPRIAPMAEIRDLGALLQRSGYALPVADSEPVQTSYESPWHLMKELRAMGEGNALKDRVRGFTARSVLLEAARIYAKSFSDDSGRIEATYELIFLTGWAPDESQPQPLRPGSATTRLADVLSVTESRLKN